MGEPSQNRFGSRDRASVRAISVPLPTLDAFSKEDDPHGGQIFPGQTDASWACLCEVAPIMR